ncbi:uncharacterized protein [Lolium perenne]|uniref:uncharacterized protein n=1 Tax=Lolium perenne TaxID=4522 RepID=UPI0021F55963|nr:uncharacterized protein LOC127295637 [Lolium perenne]
MPRVAGKEEEVPGVVGKEEKMQEPIARSQVNDWLERLVDEKGEDLYRLQGVISVNESTGRFVFQGVHSMLEGCPAKPWEPDEKRINKFVFIGRNLDEAALRKAFKGCLL